MQCNKKAEAQSRVIWVQLMLLTVETSSVRSGSKSSSTASRIFNNTFDHAAFRRLILARCVESGDSRCIHAKHTPVQASSATLIASEGHTPCQSYLRSLVYKRSGVKNSTSMAIMWHLQCAFHISFILLDPRMCHGIKKKKIQEREVIGTYEALSVNDRASRITKIGQIYSWSE